MRLLPAHVVLLAVAGAAGTATAAPERALYTISIGQNEIPERLRASDDEGLSALRYADDDAANFHSFMRPMSRQAFLLAVLDAETQHRFPALARATRVPSAEAVAGVVASIKEAMQRDRSAGREPVLVLFYSGHSVRDERGGFALALFDSALNQQQLYDLIGSLPAKLVHLIVDSCHAEAIVRPRDVEARLEPLSATERRSYLEASTLARFPHVGALLASTAGTQSYEWEAYQGGVFAHEVLSGLRGGADVNGDGQIEYSELGAFLSAANLAVADVRARSQIVVHPPPADRRAALVDLAANTGRFGIRGSARGQWASHFFVETESGRRLMDVFPERDARFVLHLPSDERVYLVGPSSEVAVEPVAGAERDLDGLPAARARARARGAVDAALRRGLFSTAFGPSFYRGYVSRDPTLVAVTMPADGSASDRPGLRLGAPSIADGSARRTTAVVLLAGAGAAAVAAGLFGALTLDARSRYEGTTIEIEAAQARLDFNRYQKWTWISAISSATLALAGGLFLTWSPARSSAANDPSVAGSF